MYVRVMPSGVRARNQTLSRDVAFALLMALAVRAKLFDAQTPFVAAVCAAGLFCGAPVWALAAGCLAAGPFIASGAAAFSSMATCAAAYAMYAVAKALRLDDRDVLIAVVAGVAGFVPALFPPLRPANGLWMAAVGALISLSCAPVLTGALSLRTPRMPENVEEGISFSLTGLIALLGVAGLPVIGGYAAEGVAAIATVALSALGAGVGACTGLLSGTMLAFAGKEACLGVTLGACGLMSGTLRGLGGRYVSLGCLVAADVLAMLYGAEAPYGAMHPLAVAAVCVIYIVLPEAWLRQIELGGAVQSVAAISPEPGRRRLRAMEGVFAELADGFGTALALPDEQALTRQLRQRLCGGCPDAAKCWGGGSGRAGRMLCRLLTEALMGRPVGAGDDTPPEICRWCRRGASIPERLGAMLTEFSGRRESVLGKSACDRLMGAQFEEGRRLLSGLREALEDGDACDPAMTKTARAALWRIGLRAETVAYAEKDAPVVMARMARGWTDAERDAAEDALGEAFGAPMHARGVDKNCLRFAKMPPYRAVAGYCGCARAEDAPCGDSRAAVSLPDGRVLLALSDGMGSGKRAADESGAAVRMLKRFLGAGIECAQALAMVNRLLLLGGEKEMYCTMDVCVIDLEECRASFAKLGACSSYVLCRDGVRRIEGGRLPLGILDSVDPSRSECPLSDGDVVVMLTDGIADETDEAQMKRLMHFLRGEARNMPPRKLCEELARMSENAGKDDMTAMAVRIAALRVP